VPQLIRDGRVPRPGIGIIAAPDEVAARAGVVGVVIAAVQPGSPAAAAGLVGIDRSTNGVGDVITQVEGRSIRTITELTSALEKLGVGKKASLTLQRDGRTRNAVVGITDIAG
jgi:2-alkenal reductase